MDEEYDRIDELFGSNEQIDLALSFSRISDYDRNGPKALDKKTFVSGQGVKIGSITDDWLLNRENFDDIYFVFNGDKPTATLGKLVDIILENYANIPPKEEIFNIIKKNEFWKRSKPETVEGYFDNPEFWSYLKAMFKGREKELITTSEFALGQDLATVLTTHQFSKHLFNNNFEKITQWKFNFNYSGARIRGIIDLILIDHDQKTVRLIDLKTGADTADNFLNSFIKYRYYFQAALYQMAFSVLQEEYGLKDYKLEPFTFLYIGRKEQLPIEYTVSEKWINAAWDGFVTLGGYDYKGIDELLEEIQWHWQNKVFDMPRNAYENNGTMLLKDSFFNVKE
tara:strand:+ start:3154 stop:4170 length:1017 start_codon:yes stop_codon:yes gene_type:complete